MKTVSLREWFLLDARSQDPDALVSRVSAAGFDAFLPKLSCSEAIFPGYIFVSADPERDMNRLRNCGADIRFVTNESNRPLAMSETFVDALSRPRSDTGQALRKSLAAMAPEYRIDRLLLETAGSRFA